MTVEVARTGDAHLGEVGGIRPMSGPLVSILINNYNYGRFLTAAVDSALSQRYPSTEVIVVDDGSTDESPTIIASYGDRIVPVLKANGGQGSAFNAGVAASRGDILCFLDADDLFYPEKVDRVVQAFRGLDVNSKPAMVHHLLAIKNDSGGDTDMSPCGKTHSSPMNLYSFAERHHFLWYEAGPTTTLAINRALADRLFPLPEKGVRISGDDFIVHGAFLIGDVYSIGEILGEYRIHGNNNFFHSSRRKSQEFLDVLERYLNDKLVENGLSPVISFDNSIHAWSRLVDDRRWMKLSWHMLKLSIKHHDRYTALTVYHRLITLGMWAKKTLMSKMSRL